MLDLESIRENNKFNEPETLEKLLAQEYMLGGKMIGPVLANKDNTCKQCALLHKECGERLFDDIGSVIPDCIEDYPKGVIYLYK
jgi:hypothetical protein